MKPCPYCAELIQDQAAKCRYCGEWLDPSKRPAWSGETPATAVPVAAAPPSTAAVAAPPADPIEEDDDPIDDPSAATLRVGSGGLPDLARRATQEPARSWSAPAWLANAQAAKDDGRAEPATREQVPPTDRSTLEEVALRMERIRQSAAAVRETDLGLAPRHAPAVSRATLEPEPGVTLPAGSVRAIKGKEPERRRPATRAPEPAPVLDDDYDDDAPPPALRERSRHREPLDYADRPTIPDIPREELLGDPEPPRKRRRRKPEPEPAYDDFDEPEPEPPSRSKRRKPEPPPPADDFDERDEPKDDDDFDEPLPRAAGDFDDGFLDDDDDDFGDEGDDFDDFDDMGPAPQPLPWKPILIAAGVIVVACVLLFRDYIFPGDPETDEVAEGEGAEGTDGEAEAAPEAQPEPEAKAPGEGQPAEAEGGSGGEAVAAEGAAAPQPKPAALDPETLATLDEAKKAYTAANGSPRKLKPVGEQLQGILAKAPDHPEALTLMAQVYLEQNKLEESLATSNRCVQVSPESANCWLTIGVIQESKGAKDVAKPAYQKYLDLAPEGRYAKDAQKALTRIK